MYSLIRNINRLSLPVDLQIEMFNKTIKPILLYGSEIWGFGNNDVLERVQLKFLKYVLKLKRSTPNYMVYGETGCTPLSIDIDEIMISFWCRLTKDASTKLSSIVYKSLFNATKNYEQSDLSKQFPWLAAIKTIFIKCGLINIWIHRPQYTVNGLN